MVLPKRHVCTLEDLSSEECASLLHLAGMMQRAVTSAYGTVDHAIMEQNTGKHSTQPHLHFHVLPSKGNLRQMMASYESRSERQEAGREQLQQQRDALLGYLQGNYH